MKHLFFSLLVFCSISEAQSQQLLAGVVRDTTGQVLPFAFVTQEGRLHPSMTDLDGAFHITLDTINPANLYFYAYGYKDVTLEQADTITAFLDITLAPWDTIPTHHYSKPKHAAKNDADKIGAAFAIQVDFFEHDFSAFESLLGADNVELLNKPSGILNYEMGFYGNRSYWGFFWGMLSGRKEVGRTEIRRHYSLLGLRYGYRLINSKRILLMPDISLKQYAYRLFNNSNEEEISLEEYIEEPELDLRIAQTILSFGLNLAFKFRSKDSLGDNHFTIGGYGAYGLPLYKTPALNSKRRTLEDDRKIDMNNLNFGVFMTMNFE